MNDDGIVRISTAVDVSGLRAGMDQAASNVESSSQRMAAALQQVKVASKSLADAQLQLGQAAQQGNAQAAAVIAQYEGELASARSELAAFSETQAANTAIVEANTAAMTVNATAVRSVTGSYYAAQGAAALFRGRIPIRAMERFLASSKAVSTALQYAFPVIGAIALGEIVVELGRHLQELYDKYISLQAAAQAFNDTVAQLRDKDIVNVRSIEDANLRVQQLDRSSRQLLNTANELHGSGLLGILTGFATGGTAGAGAALTQLITARQVADEGYKRRTQANEIDLKSIELNHQIATAQIEAAHAGDSALPALQKINAEEQKRLALIQEEQQYNKARDQALGNPVAANSGAQLAGFQEAAARGEAAAARATLAAQQAQEALRKAEQNTRVIFGNRNPEIPKLAQQDATKAAQEAARGIEVMQKADAEVQKWATDTSTAIDQAGEKWAHYHELVTQGAEIQAQNVSQEKLATVAAQEAAKAITPLAAAEKTAALHAEEYRLKLQLLREELQRLQAAASTDAVTGAYTNPQQAAQIQQIRNQIAQTQGQATVSGIQDQSKIQQQVVQPWLNAFSQINQGWLQVQNQMLFSTRNIGVEFAKMGQNLVISGLDSAEKWALQWIEKEIMALLFHQQSAQQWLATEQQKNAGATLSTQQAYLTQMISAQAANVAATTSTQTAAVQQATAHAGVAAAGAAASQASIPWIGPALAIAAGAAIFGEVLSLAHFETGTGWVPKTGLAVLHQGEAVIPAPTMEDLRGDKGGGGDVTVNQHNTYNGFNPDREFKRQLYRNAGHIAGALKQHHLRQTGKG